MAKYTLCACSCFQEWGILYFALRAVGILSSFFVTLECPCTIDKLHQDRIYVTMVRNVMYGAKKCFQTVERELNHRVNC